MGGDLDGITKASPGTANNKNRGADVDDAGQNPMAGGTTALTSIDNVGVDNRDIDDSNVNGSKWRKTDKSIDHVDEQQNSPAADEPAAEVAAIGTSKHEVKNNGIALKDINTDMSMQMQISQ